MESAWGKINLLIISMKKLVILLFGIVLIILFIFQWNKSFNNKFFNSKNIFTKENLIINKLLDLNNNRVVWYEYNGGVTGRGIQFIAIKDSIDSILNNLIPEDAFFESTNIQDLNLSNDTIVITVSLQDYNVKKNIGIPYFIIVDTIPWK